MYSSYAAAYDNTTRQQYVDVYGLRDVFDSIFCPESYVKKEDSIRRRKENLETVVLQPGVRIHVRMGYGADAAKLPIAFNGKIAEIEVNEVVQVVAQGDGHELYNPLNTLGDMDAVELTEAQQWTTMFKDIRGSMKRGGESPRNLLAKLLTAKYGGVLKTVVRDWITNERFYADNPFGIYHFGDHRFNSIFSEGETVQNLYEVCDATLLKGANELYTARENAMATPTINTPIQDKTFWDLLHLCANSGVGYMGAVRDFGMRSTVCLCKPNHYYAYGYKKIDDENGETEGKLIERRKPFQQYHYYDSYTDIVFNSIKASEKNMKTNAVGIWESTDMLWGKSQSTVGPIYLDMNIFPEYQKSMTVDTMLVSDGAGGLELNFFTHFSENWASDSNDNKVNKALAERVTTNVLRESVSNMYCGELCVLGDTSIKPYDRFYVNDVYEDMMGTMEVEGVVYSMNSATGFTTSIYPDAIVRADDNHEAARQLVNGAFFGSLVVGVGGRLGVIGTFARLDSVFISNLTKIAAGLTATPADEVLATYGATAIGQFLKIEKFSDVRSAVAAAFKGAWSVGSLMTAAALAVGCYIVANNVKSSIGSFLRNINALTVYPIMKNQRPLLAGMAGHKGSVYGYEYSEEDKEDSIQGLIYKSVEWMNGANDKFEKVFPFEIGDLIMGALTRKVDDGNGNKVSEYELAKNKWAQTLPMIDGRAQGFTYDSNMTDEEKREVFVQTLQGASSKEFSSRRQMIPALRTKWRIPNLLVSKDDATYKSYHISGVNSINGLVTNSKILDLYPIEDELEIKQAVVKNSHPVIKQLYIAHSQGNAKVQMPFESGNRIIKFFTEPKDGAYIYDLPMLQEDALMILKLILNDQALKNKEVSFLSGARINDTKAWKSTGLSFVLDCNNKKALKSALDNVIEQTSTFDAEPKPIFEYKESDGGFVIVVYAPMKQGMYTAPVSTTSKDDTNNTNNGSSSNNNNSSNNKPTGGTVTNNTPTTSTPSSNPTYGEGNTNTSKPTPSVPSNSTPALKTAQRYLDSEYQTGFSKKGLKEQLEFEGFTSSEIQYALDNVKVDYNQQALKAAQKYLDSEYQNGFSKEELRKQLEFEGFTSSEIQYALNNVKTDYKQQALKAAQGYLDSEYQTGFSKEGLIQQLKDEFGEEFTDEEIQYALSNVKVNWNQQALKAAKNYLKNGIVTTKEGLKEQLKFEGFTSSEIQYALNQLY
jgi:SOS response regulatory protein OraA/RecX